MEGTSAKYQTTKDNKNRKIENKEQYFSIGAPYISKLQSVNTMSGQFGSGHFMYTPWKKEFEEYNYTQTIFFTLNQEEYYLIEKRIIIRVTMIIHGNHNHYYLYLNDTINQ